MRLGMTFLISHPQSPPVIDQLELYKNAGFDSVFIGSDTVHDLEDIPKIADAARTVGIVLEAFHAPSGGLNDLWMPDDDKAEASLQTLFDAVDACDVANVEKLVMHTAGGEPTITEYALRRFSEFEAYAAKRGVTLCYENAGSMSTLAAVMDHASSPHGFCFDAGHQLCYSPDVPLLRLYGDRMLYTHLHDNDGLADRHYLPFDGIRDWRLLAKSLAEIGYSGTLNLELACHSSAAYRSLPFRDFVNEAYARLHRFERMVIEEQDRSSDGQKGKIE